MTMTGAGAGAGAGDSPTAYSPLGAAAAHAGNNGNRQAGTSFSSSSYQAIPIQQQHQQEQRLPQKRSNYFLSVASPGVSNSLSAFSNSYQRAQSFRSISIEPRIKASRSFFKDDEELIDPSTFRPSPMGRKISTVFGMRPNFQSESSQHNNVFDDVDDDHSFVDDNTFTDYVISRQPSFASSVFPAPGNQLSRVFTNDADSIVVRQIETNDGVKLTMIAPQSTIPQTIFNCINALIGIGLLALSRALVHAGLLYGTILILYSVCITYWTATLLSECMDTDPTLCTYADIGYKAFGPRARLFVSLLFTVELLGVGVSLMVLFADSLHALFPSISLIQFKWIAFVILTPFSFLPLNVLSHISLVGIISTISLVFLICFSGLVKQTAPGSLIDPVAMNWLPPSWPNLFVSYGIILGPFGSHSLFPALKADLVKPQAFEKCLKTTYSIGFFADSAMAYLGFFMFGAGILNEITQSLLLTSGYPKFVYFLASIFVSLIPVAKTPINALPIINITEFLFGITPQQLESSGKNFTFGTKIGSSLIKIGVNLMFVLLGILYPEFDKIIGLSGSSLCTLICIVLPCAFYLKLCKPRNRWFYHTVMVVAMIFGVVSTAAALMY
jgi:solute carrier family 32 (vesicular inhibitory amino acid transporter)